MIKGTGAGLKKSLALGAICLLAFLAAAIVQAAEGLKLAASREQDGSGQIVSVTIRAENAEGSEGGQFVLNFDPALVKPVAVEAGELVTEAASALQMANLEYDQGRLMFMWVTAAADTADVGEICRIEFKLLTDGVTVLDFEDIIISPDDMQLAVPVSGQITIGDTGVDQEEIVQQEFDEDEAVEAGGDEKFGDGLELAEEIVNDVENNNYILVVALIVLVVLGAAGFVIFKRKKAGSR